MKLDHVTDVIVTVGAPISLGPVAGGLREIIPITGGQFAGPMLSGTVLPIGADWALVLQDDSAFVDARYVLRMADGVHVGIRNRGYCRPVPGTGNVWSGLSQPEFEAPEDSAHDWMNRATFACSFTSDLGKGEVRLAFFRVVDEQDG